MSESDPYAAPKRAPEPQRSNGSAPHPGSRSRSRRTRGTNIPESIVLPPATGRRRPRGRAAPSIALTSQPTGRNAMMETRAWLLATHGPVCAYCGVRFTARVMTLDHVAPRRGQKAYDRRDNIVLACPGCNILKRDQSPLAFLLASRSRAANLVKYGEHLSQMLFDLAQSLVPASVPVPKSSTHKYSTKHASNGDANGESPYKD